MSSCHQVLLVEQILKRHGLIRNIFYKCIGFGDLKTGPARTMAGCVGKCVGHDVDELNTTRLERINKFRSCTFMIKAWLSLCLFSLSGSMLLGICSSTTYLVDAARFLPLRWRHLVYSCLYSCTSCAGGFVLWHRRTWYLEWTHGTDSCLQNVFFWASERGKQRMLFLWMGFGEDECI